KTRIGDCRRQPESGELLRCLHTLGEAAAKAKQRDCGALAQDSASADLEWHAPLGERYSDPFAARVTHRRWPVVEGHASRDHVYQLGLVTRGHDHETRQAAEIGDVERACMGLAVLANEA